MAEHPILYRIELAGRDFEVRTIRGVERLSAPFRFEVRVLLERGEMLLPSDVLKTEARISLARNGVAERKVSGIVTSVKIAAARQGVRPVDVVIEPRLSLARFRTDIRIFRDKTAPEMVIETLSQIGVVPELRLGESYTRRPYTVEMRETDLDFCHRMMEDEGIFYFFTDDGTMVLGDGPGAYEAIHGVSLLPFRAASGLDHQGEAVTEMGARAALVPDKVSFRDFDHEHPNLTLEVSSGVPSPSGVEWYDFPGEYVKPSDGERRAKVSGEAFLHAAEVAVGTSTSGRLVPGHTFVLDDAPPGVEDGGYAVTRVDHAWDRDTEGFSIAFEALRDKVTYRPVRDAEIPELLNPWTGIVSGPPGADDIYTDEWGRVKVHFPWDRRQPDDGTCSHWIPIVQDNTGQSSAIVRRGWEVLVHFLEGDPDRPVVLGRVYNGDDPFPETLPLHKTRSALKSLSTPSRDGTNEIRFQDLAGQQQVRVYAQKDQNIVIANDKTEVVVNNETHSITRDETISIGNDHALTSAADVRTEVGGSQSWSVGGSRSRDVASADSTTVAGDRSITIGGMHMRKMGTFDETGSKDLKETVGGVILETSLKGNQTTIGSIGTLTVGGAVIELAMHNKMETVEKVRAETIGGLAFTKASQNIDIRSQKTRNTSATLFKLKAKEEIAMTAVETLTWNLGQGDLSAGKSVKLKVKDTEVVLKEGAIHVTAQTKITLTVTAKSAQGAKKSTQI